MKKTLVILLAGLVILSGYQACSSWAFSSEGARMDRMENSPQYREGKFRNAVEWEQPPLWKNLALIPKFLFADNQRTPKTLLPVRRVDLTEFGRPGRNRLSATWLGHSSLMINIDGFRILSDPVFEKKVSIVGPTRFNGEVPLDIALIPDVDVVLISHDHYDHLNEFSIRHLTARTSLFAVPLGVGARLEEWEVPPEKIRELDWWEELSVGERLTIASTPAQHFSGRGLTDRNETLWTSWVVDGPDHRIYISGDSGYFDGFAQIGERYGPFDMTFMECGAYDERWHPIHMFPEETVQAHLDLRGKVLHPIHWATFNLGLHPWYEPMRRLRTAADAAGVVAATPIVGETTVYATAVPETKWWEEAIVAANGN